MKIVMSVLVVLSLAASVAAQGAQPPTPAPAGEARQQRPAAQFKKLTRAEFDALVANPAGVLILDVRRPDELTSIGGFGVYLSVQAAELEKRLAFIPKDRAIITVSNHSARAGRAAELLAKNGFTVAGGIGAQDYEAEGGALVKIAAPAPAQATAGAAPAASGR